VNLCSHNHSEVCFEERECPVCEAKQQWKDETDDMVKDIKNLQSEIANLERQLESTQT
jgi:hypothetical protein